MDPFAASGAASAMPKPLGRAIHLHVYFSDGTTLNKPYQVYPASLASQDDKARRLLVNNIQDVDLEAFRAFIKARVEGHDPVKYKLTWNDVYGQSAVSDQFDWETALTRQLNSMTSPSDTFVTRTL